MPRSDDIYKLPKDLPIPKDDGRASHLTEGYPLPDVNLNGVNLSKLEGINVIFIYPRTGSPMLEPPEGWNKIAGARGCTPQNANFNNHYEEFCQSRVNLYGLSSQDKEYQDELKTRLGLKFDLISDPELKLKDIMNLPTFKVGEMELYSRLTIVAEDGKIKKTFYPVFPPDKNAEEVLEFIRSL